MPDLPGYYLDVKGRVWSTRTRSAVHVRSPPHLRKLEIHPSGYPRLHACVDRVRSHHFVHHLILKTFKGPKPGPGYEARHLNGVRTDNRPENLEWATHLENEKDKRAHGTLLEGSRHPRAKLTEADVKQIRLRRSNGEKLFSIAADFGVSQSLISNICLRHGWRHVS